MSYDHNNAHTFIINIRSSFDDARIASHMFAFIASNIADINDVSHVDDVRDTYTFEIVHTSSHTRASFERATTLRVTSYIDNASFDTLFYIDDDDNVSCMSIDA